MTPEQLKELSTVSANMVHVLQTVQKLDRAMEGLATREELREFITRREHEYERSTLEGRVQRLEDKVKDNAPLSVWQRMTQVLAGVAVLFTVLGSLYGFALFLSSKQITAAVESKR